MTKQAQPVDPMIEQVFDLAVIGGGINGCGIARDAVGRGLSVCLLEMNDLASATSSASSKMIHGGLRYLENYEFRLVRESLKEREVLLTIAPHLVSPLRFVFPHDKTMRPVWMIRLGLFLYDHLYRRRILPASRGMTLSREVVGEPLNPRYKKAFIYSDARVDDARLVVLNAVDAAGKGAEIRTRTRFKNARRVDGLWHVSATRCDKEPISIAARSLVNAAGPWVGDVIGDCQAERGKQSIRMVKGSHIVVPKLFDHDKAYILQNPDKRIVFAIPYQRDFTLIGTTDEEFIGDPADVCASEAEIGYLCDIANRYFRRKTKPSDVVWQYAGIRPLFDDGALQAQNATRDYVLTLADKNGAAPVLNVFGGKITTYRKLAEAALEKLRPYFPRMTDGWTDRAFLPGGDKISGLADEINLKFPFLGKERCERLVAAYGSNVHQMLADVTSETDLGVHFGAGLSQREVLYLMEREFAVMADDVLWRRSKLGLRLNDTQIAELQNWMNEQ
jgi:glycerol-3-phosphate dehydrogenase